jgi:hypothetical protein
MEKPDNKFVSNDSAPLAVWVVAAVLLAIGLAIAYWVWPAGITDLTLANITFGVFLRAAASGAIGLVALVMVVMILN